MNFTLRTIGYNQSDFKVNVEFLIYSWASFLIGLLGTILVIVALIFLIIFQRHPIFKASTIFFNYPIITGLVFGNLANILGLFEISPLICELKTNCYFQFTGIFYYSLLIKVIRIYRIYRASHKGISYVSFTSNASIIFQFTFLLFIQVIFLSNFLFRLLI